MIMRSSYLVVTGVLAGLMSPAVAQVDPDALPDGEAEEVVEPIRRYSVELIIFTYSAGSSTGSEIWLADESAVSASGYDRFDEYGDALTEIETTVARRTMNLELELFGKDDYTMNGIYDKLVELDAYEPLIRTGWTQATYDKELTGPLPLQSLAEHPSWLDGSLTLYRGRYLHLVVDLTMNSDRSDSERAADDAGADPSFGDSRVRKEFGTIDAYGELLAPAIHYRIFEDRIVKNGDIRYFDHPKFGMIAKITRQAEPEEAVPSDDTDDLLPGG
jgi:hypothetical protein